MLAGVTLGIGVGFLLAGLGYLKTRWATRRLTRHRGRDDASVAVVIATRNEESVIENTLRTLLTTAPPGVRVLVVDESTDATPEILRRLTLEFPNLELLSDPQVRGKPAALNLALDHVTEDIVLLLDADARVDGAFLAEYTALFANPQVQAVFADFSSYNARRSLPVVFQDLFFAFAKAFVFSGLVWRPVFMNCGVFVRREVFHQVGKFDPRTTVDDFDLGIRMAKQGLHAAFVLGRRCHIQYALGLRDLFRQHCRWYTGGIKKMFEEIGRGDLSYVVVMAGVGMVVYFPQMALILGGALSNPFLVAVVLPGAMSALWAAATFAYLLHRPQSGREVLANVVLGFPAVYLLLQAAIAVSFFRAFTSNHSWYKVRRERA